MSNKRLILCLISASLLFGCALAGGSGFTKCSQEEIHNDVSITAVLDFGTKYLCEKASTKYGITCKDVDITQVVSVSKQELKSKTNFDCSILATNNDGATFKGTFTIEYKEKTGEKIVRKWQYNVDYKTNNNNDQPSNPQNEGLTNSILEFGAKYICEKASAKYGITCKDVDITQVVSVSQQKLKAKTNFQCSIVATNNDGATLKGTFTVEYKEKTGEKIVRKWQYHVNYKNNDTSDDCEDDVEVPQPQPQPEPEPQPQPEEEECVDTEVDVEVDVETPQPEPEEEECITPVPEPQPEEECVDTEVDVEVDVEEPQPEAEEEECITTPVQPEEEECINPEVDVEVEVPQPEAEEEECITPEEPKPEEEECIETEVDVEVEVPETETEEDCTNTEVDVEVEVPQPEAEEEECITPEEPKPEEEECIETEVDVEVEVPQPEAEEEECITPEEPKPEEEECIETEVDVEVEVPETETEEDCTNTEVEVEVPQVEEDCTNTEVDVEVEVPQPEAEEEECITPEEPQPEQEEEDCTNTEVDVEVDVEVEVPEPEQEEEDCVNTEVEVEVPEVEEDCTTEVDVEVDVEVPQPETEEDCTNTEVDVEVTLPETEEEECTTDDSQQGDALTNEILKFGAEYVFQKAAVKYGVSADNVQVTQVNSVSKEQTGDCTNYVCDIKAINGSGATVQAQLTVEYNNKTQGKIVRKWKYSIKW